VELHRKETSVEESPRHGSCTDPEWSPSNGREEASSGTSPAGASGGSQIFHHLRYTYAVACNVYTQVAGLRWST
jgi:hypothetical protein